MTVPSGDAQSRVCSLASIGVIIVIIASAYLKSAVVDCIIWSAALTTLAFIS